MSAATRACPDCKLRFQDLNRGRVSGICERCTDALYLEAAKRGVGLNIPSGSKPKIDELTVNGRHIWWWRNQWRLSQ